MKCRRARERGREGERERGREGERERGREGEGERGREREEREIKTGKVFQISSRH